MFRPVFTLPLPATAQLQLRENGYLYLEDVSSHRGVAPEARKILQKWDLHSNELWNKLSTPPHTLSSLDLWQEEFASSEIVTWSKDVDVMLGGGICFETITELCGAPGSGKTQMCLQLCVDVQIPSCLGGLSGEAVYIDTASNFSPQRLKEMANACCIHCNSLLSNEKTEMKNLDSNSILDGVKFISIHGISQLLAAIKLLPSLLQQQPKVRLIVIDSLSFPFTCGDNCNTIDRTSFVYRILSDLQKLALQHKLAVVVTNQLTTRLVNSALSKGELGPALGESMGHRVTQRLLLGRLHRNSYAAVMLKGNNQSTLSAKFKITEAGIRDVQ